MQRAVTVQSHSVERKIHQTLKCIQETRHIRETKTPQRRNTPKHTSQEALYLQAVKREKEIQRLLAH